MKSFTLHALHDWAQQVGFQFIEQYAGLAKMTEAVREAHGESTAHLDYEYHRGMNILEESGFLSLALLTDSIQINFNMICWDHASHVRWHPPAAQDTLRQHLARRPERLRPVESHQVQHMGEHRSRFVP